MLVGYAAAAVVAAAATVVIVVVAVVDVACNLYLFRQEILITTLFAVEYLMRLYSSPGAQLQRPYRSYHP